MWFSLARRTLVLAGAVFVLSCASSETPRAPPGPQPGGGATSARATIDRLERRQALTPSERVALGDAYIEVGDAGSAEQKYFAALAQSGLTPDETFHARFGLGRASELRSATAAARVAYQNAWKAAATDRERDDSLIALCRTDMQAQDLVAAREHRKAIRDTIRPEVSEIDRQLGAVAAVPRAGGGAESGGARPAGRGVTPPAMFSRARWNARPPLRERELEPMSKIYRLTLHHGGDITMPGPSEAENAKHVLAYQNGHVVGNHWADIGYHFVVDRQGRIWEGRSLKWRGAHAGSHALNEGNVGIVLFGNFEQIKPTDVQVRATQELVDWLCAEYGIRAKEIWSHNVIRPLGGLPGTECPGKYFLPKVAEIRRNVAAQQKRAGG